MRSPRSSPTVSFGCEIFLLCFASTALTFFIAGLLFICALSTSITWERTPHPVPETGLLIPSDCFSRQRTFKELRDNVGVKPGRKPIQISPAVSLLLLQLWLPLLLVGGAVSIPYSKIRRRIMARREGKFTESMKLKRRVMDWADFVRELDRGNGMLIVERFSFKGPVRLWWTVDDLYKMCPYPLVDWQTMVMVEDETFDAVRDWFHAKYTGVAGEAMLVTGGTKDQRRSIRGDDPLSFREGIQWVEVPPPRKS